MICIYLIRHSEAVKNKNTDVNNILANKNIELSELGNKKALEFSESKYFKNIDEVYSSDYVRAFNTAKYIADKNHIKINVSKDLGERIGGIPNFNITPKEYFKYQLENPNFKFKGGESLNEVKKRMLHVINYIINKKDNVNVVLVSHGAAITFLLNEWCKIEITNIENKQRKIKFKDKTIFDDKIKNLEIFRLTFEQKELINIENII